ncbi:hypothetical protein GEMRC1_000921 [Eukaryota sp. GEM-RC1]
MADPTITRSGRVSRPPVVPPNILQEQADEEHAQLLKQCSKKLWKSPAAISVYLSPEIHSLDIFEEKPSSSSSAKEKSSLDSDSEELSAPAQRANLTEVISHGVIDLLKITLPSALSPQSELWEYLISLTLCSSASEARSLLSSLSTDNCIHQPLAKTKTFSTSASQSPDAVTA